jgi:hypothetical protein
MKGRIYLTGEEVFFAENKGTLMKAEKYSVWMKSGWIAI